MAEPIYEDSVYRFTDPVRFFKANDPYYFEVDNIPLKQLQENCLWLRDQVNKSSLKFTGVKRADIEELRPYATGGDRLLRVKPGRFTARINDATTKEPLAYLAKVMGAALGDVDAWSTATNNEGDYPGDKSPSWNTLLSTTLDKFKSLLSQDALGMTGLVERAFTWPVVNVDTPVDNDGVNMVSNTTYLQYGDASINNPGGGASISPTVISEAITWAKSINNTSNSFALPSFETTNITNGWAKFPRTESWFIKKWRGVSRLAIVDVDDEISVEVPAFDPTDFNYIDESGAEVTVAGVQNRIDLVFIYSKAVDASSATILQSTGKSVITKPQLGIVRGAGIKANFSAKQKFSEGHVTDTGQDHKILASPGDQNNEQMGFTSTSANDIAYDVRGSFPSPDDILNLAPLISEKLEDEAFELVGQSILPVAYVWVKNSGSPLANGSVPILSTDVIDIRPLFRTAELAYNERAGIGAAFPQLSLANPAVGKAQLDYENKRLFDNFNSEIANLENRVGVEDNTSVLATGYVFGGWNFGPEGALFDFYSTQFGVDDPLGNPDGIFGSDTQTVRAYIRGKYGIGGDSAQINIPAYPDWDLSQWCALQDIGDKGLYPNDYINTFVSLTNEDNNDPSIVGGSYRQLVNQDGTTTGGGSPTRLGDFTNTKLTGAPMTSLINFNYISKRIKFNRTAVPWLSDYNVDCTFVNCLPQNNRGGDYKSGSPNDEQAGSYFGWWVEKGFDEFTIYVAFIAPDNNLHSNSQVARYPAPHSTTFTSGGKKKKVTQTLSVSERAGERFSSFVVPVGDLLGANTTPVSESVGYVGNPRIGKCTYPTLMWNFVGVPVNDNSYLYGNLNGTDPTISLKSN
jgi:hypothetical protein